MARRVLRRERVDQPQSRPNLSQLGSRANYLITFPDAVNQISGQRVTPLSYVVSQGLVGSTLGLSNFRDYAAPPLGAFSCLIVFELLNTSTATFVYTSDTSTSALQIRHDIGRIEVLRSDVAIVFFSTGPSLVVGRRYTAFIAHDPAAGIGYIAIDGRLAGTTTSTTGYSTVAMYSIGKRVSTESADHRQFLHARWNQLIPQVEGVALSANPWQLFEPQARSMSWATGTAYMQSVLGSLTLSSLISRQTNKQVIGSATTSGVITRHTSTREQGSITTSAGPVVGGNFAQSASGSITLSSVLTDVVTFVRSYGSVINLSGALAKPVSKILRGTIALVGSVFKLVTKATFTASMAIAGALSAFSFTPGGGGNVLGRGLRFMRKFIGRR